MVLRYCRNFFIFVAFRGDFFGFSIISCISKIFGNVRARACTCVHVCVHARIFTRVPAFGGPHHMSCRVAAAINVRNLEILKNCEILKCDENLDFV